MAIVLAIDSETLFVILVSGAMTIVQACEKRAANSTDYLADHRVYQEPY
jgi:hypothetical protein